MDRLFYNRLTGAITTSAGRVLDTAPTLTEAATQFPNAVFMQYDDEEDFDRIHRSAFPDIDAIARGLKRRTA